jgi:glycosyltransferase involved in cell wall biosynthesis
MAPAQPLVTVVMAAWNPRPDWLLEAVRSALAQRDVELELVVVDDGSDTPLSDVLSGIEDPRLQIVRVDHGGASSARNAGVAAAR